MGSLPVEFGKGWSRPFVRQVTKFGPQRRGSAFEFGAKFFSIEWQNAAYGAREVAEILGNLLLFEKQEPQLVCGFNTLQRFDQNRL